MKSAAPLLVFLLGACTQMPSGETRTIAWHMVDDPRQVCARLLPGREALSPKACAKFDGATCVIYARRPADEHDLRAMAVLGHELLHCFDGAFHG